MSVEVSIIVPVYNSEKYLEECLESLIKQNTDINYQIILIDDGSYDGSSVICKRYQSKYKPKVLYERIENSGVSIARNKGIEVSNSKYICFVDSDDVVSSEYISLLYGNILGTEISFSKYESGDIKKINLTSRKYISKVLTKNKIQKNFLTNKITTLFCTYMFLSSIIKKNNLWFSSELKFSEDREFVWKYLHFVKAGAYISKKLYFYRRHEESAMAKITLRRLDSLKSIELTCNFYNEVNDEFKKFFSNYSKPRALLSISIFYIKNSPKLYLHIKNIYDLKLEFRKLLKFPVLKIRIISLVYMINEKLFVKIIRKSTL